ncbi:hypothetical protein CBA19CS22_16345 [Caballeronia novacaledonica]|uniref:Uncharacterized protein n=2 Tax=Caballeronia novacaledonica TaxID=1544861 RepID=A0ACB5QT20_9BURK|nr:hypothetical protein [Caballeronia novacaledonica]GJH18133.1 hypothetical protein CBA19CS22_16345 [Caballeronia novacaledonica]GJH25876.1 hypothetical protein CBA19CS42_15190 [Caballeronia novacaledonica]
MSTNKVTQASLTILEMGGREIGTGKYQDAFDFLEQLDQQGVNEAGDSGTKC